MSSSCSRGSWLGCRHQLGTTRRLHRFLLPPPPAPPGLLPAAREHAGQRHRGARQVPQAWRRALPLPRPHVHGTHPQQPVVRTGALAGRHGSSSSSSSCPGHWLLAVLLPWLLHSYEVNLPRSTQTPGPFLPSPCSRQRHCDFQNSMEGWAEFLDEMKQYYGVSMDCLSGGQGGWCGLCPGWPVCVRLHCA